ncbi:KdsC family phosphatase [Halothermothrix orenii]|uniref:3-deoxy-D-manno-octulosonate 8-phosphate phosphatase, YrbI family n=1 Tax=Halothermothrix orenii (strain H 168 / OCM 544 / DSM 9562) TaxID=373903 RepID=B8D241_HALOH|nr:HAD-IIIA family hydrolase [Halothermothrix orenii]ACL69268.1 3-deoxy-D-manno-octulosonate 8-phosphate phosphatase, YrbI family [Halothermothrix orenii H 168]
MDKTIVEKAARINLIITDVDGVLTDGRIVLGNNGEEFKFFHVQDGQGIKRAQKAGLKVAIITGRISKAVDRRAKELNIGEVYQGVNDKLIIYKKLCNKYNLKNEEVAYIGDDIADLDVLKEVGFACSVKNGVSAVKEMVDYVTDREGGRGAVREVIDLILEARSNPV